MFKHVQSKLHHFWIVDLCADDREPARLDNMYGVQIKRNYAVVGPRYLKKALFNCP